MPHPPETISPAHAPPAALWRAAAAWLAVQDNASRLAAPWADFAIRVFFAQLVWRNGVAGLMHWQARLAQAADYARYSPMSAPHAAVAQTGLEFVLPVLLVAGLLVRPVALLLALAGVAAWRMDPAGQAGVLPALLGVWFFAVGAGRFSLDRALARGIGSSALPLAPAFTRLGAAMSAVLGPLAALAVRLGIAALLLRAGMAGQPWVLAAAALVAVGLAARLAALPLLGVSAMAAMHAMSQAHLGWVLLLCLIIAFGPGRISLDWCIGFLLRRRWERFAAWRAAELAGLPHVVIVGGGFGGLAVAHGLRAAPCRVTLVDQRNYHLFQPLLYQVATAGLSPADIATPIRSHLRGQANARVRLARVQGVEPAARLVVMQDGGWLQYDMLVLATGAQHAYFGNDAWAPFAPGLKTIEDATDIRGRLLLAFEQAEAASDPALQQALLTFAIVGGGPTGVELAGAVAELARHGLEGEFRSIDPAQARVILVQAADRLLPAFAPGLSAKAAVALRRLGVEVRLNARVTSVTADSVAVGGEILACRTVFWAAGVAASPAAAWLDAAADSAGRVIVAADLSVPGHDGVFALGDTAAVAAPDGAVPGLAPAAKQGGAYVARVIAARLGGGAVPAPFRYHHEGSLATIGRREAVADFGHVRLSGALAWWVWGAAHILFLAGARNRLTVAVQWLWAYLTFGRGIRLITRPAEFIPGSGR